MCICPGTRSIAVSSIPGMFKVKQNQSQIHRLLRVAVLTSKPTPQWSTSSTWHILNACKELSLELLMNPQLWFTTSTLYIILADSRIKFPFLVAHPQHSKFSIHNSPVLHPFLYLAFFFFFFLQKHDDLATVYATDKIHWSSVSYPHSNSDVQPYGVV